MQLKNHIRLIYSAGGIGIALLVIFGIVYLSKSQRHLAYVEKVEETHQVLSAINLCEKLILDAESAQRGYLLTEVQEYKLHFYATLPAIDSIVRVLENLTAENPQQKVFVSELKKHARLKVEFLLRNITLPANDAQFSDNMRSGANAMEHTRFYMNKMRQEEERLLIENSSIKDTEQQTNNLYFRATFVTAALICFLMIVVFVREVRKRVFAQQALKLKVSELSNSKQELEEIAYAASHDIQEPVRKIRILSSLMIKNFTNRIPEPEMEIVYRVNKITERMHLLLHDLVIYTNLLKRDEKRAAVNLYDIFKSAHDKVFANYPVTYDVKGPLPVITGISGQLESMVVQLFDNSLKFKSPERDLVITITHQIIKSRDARHTSRFATGSMIHEITIADNGIGFDKEYNDKIFGLFQRLHTQTAFPGKGMGLAIARRVMANHFGDIFSGQNRTAGAEFILHFPAEE